MPAEHLLHHVRLPGAEQTVVDENACQLISDRLVDQRGGHAGINPAAQPQNDVFVTDLPADVLNCLIDVVAHRPVPAAAADLVNEIGNDLHALRRVHDLRVELHAEELLLAILDDRVVAVLGGRDRREVARCTGELVSVRIPHLDLPRQTVEQIAGRIENGERALAKLPLLPAFHLATHGLGHHLQSVTDRQHRHTEPEHALVRQRRIPVVYAAGSSRKDDPAGIHRLDLGRRRAKWQDHRIDIALADASRDELGVLGTKIKNDSRCTTRRVWVRGRLFRQPGCRPAFGPTAPAARTPGSPPVPTAQASPDTCPRQPDTG